MFILYCLVCFAWKPWYLWHNFIIILICRIMSGGLCHDFNLICILSYGIAKFTSVHQTVINIGRNLSNSNNLSFSLAVTTIIISWFFLNYKSTHFISPFWSNRLMASLRMCHLPLPLRNRRSIFQIMHRHFFGYCHYAQEI